MKNLWLYTEERPKKDVLETLVKRFADDRNLNVSIDDSVKILPVMNGKVFTFLYKIEGIACDDVESIFVATVSGGSSFADYIVFHSENKPAAEDKPLYIIEETKTDDSESRNTGVYQRSSKFVYADFFYPDVPKIMMYNLKVKQKETPTSTSIFGTKMLRTLGVEIWGKELTDGLYEPFQSVEELIEQKNAMNPPRNGVPIRLTKTGNTISVSAKLLNQGRLASDPSIGTTTMISACFRKLGWEGDIVITQHCLPTQRSVGKTNKFIQIANKLNIKLEGLNVPQAKLADSYWSAEDHKEKLGTIFLSILCEEFSNSVAIYENHGGCERGYFISTVDEELKPEHFVIQKYTDRDEYKAGDKTAIVYIPDVVIYDRDRKLVINGEGKTFANREQGYEEINNFDFFEEHFVNKYYPEASIQRSLILYGGNESELDDKRIDFLLNEEGVVLIGDNAPETIKHSWSNLLSS